MPPRFILDTDICIYLLTGRAPEVAERLRHMLATDVGTTAITAAELRYGALHSAKPAANLERVETFLAALETLPFDNAAATQFATIKQNLASRGTPIGVMDLLIAGIAVASGVTLVTNNVREFSRVETLSVVNWRQ